jgi:phosphate/sulfate permease
MIKLILAAVLACTGLFAAFAAALDTPVGSYNAVTGACIGVTTPQGVVPCKGAPRHEHEPVSPEMTYKMLQKSFVGKSK